MECYKDVKINGHDLKRWNVYKFENELDAMNNNNNRRTIRHYGILEIQK